MSGATAQAIVESEVRELVRRRGLDPIAAPDVVARLVDEVVADYRDRAITSALPPMGDVALVSRAVLDAVAGFGTLQPLLDDPDVEEIWIKDRLGGALACAVTGVPDRNLVSDYRCANRPFQALWRCRCRGLASQAA